MNSPKISMIVCAVIVVLGLYIIASVETVKKDWGQWGRQGYTVVIPATLQDTALVCVEPVMTGKVSCRTVKEFRTWATQ